MTIAVPIGILMGFVTMFVNNIFLTVFTTLMDKWALEGNERGLLIYLNFGVWLAKICSLLLSYSSVYMSATMQLKHLWIPSRMLS